MRFLQGIFVLIASAHTIVALDNSGVATEHPNIASTAAVMRDMVDGDFAVRQVDVRLQVPEALRDLRNPFTEVVDALRQCQDGHESGMPSC